MNKSSVTMVHFVDAYDVAPSTAQIAFFSNSYNPGWDYAKTTFSSGRYSAF